MSGGININYTGHHNRRSIRLHGYDYSQPGAYFVTICIHDRAQRLFGNVVGGKMVLNDAGKSAQRCWVDIPMHFPDVKLDEFVVMPNHVHGVIVIRSNATSTDAGVPNNFVGVQNFEPLQRKQRDITATRRVNQYQHILPRSIGSIIRGYKIGVSKWFRERTPNAIVWQRNYYDRIIRDGNSFYFIRKYIRDNPKQWNSDSENHLNNEINEFYSK
jgi:putative transposase